MKRLYAGILFLFLVAGALIAAGKKFKVGDRVIANYEMQAFGYSAKITAINGNQVSVQYDDDNSMETLDQKWISAFNWKAGTKIFCKWQNEDTYYPGIINSIDGVNLTVVYDLGDAEKKTIGGCRELNHPEMVKNEEAPQGVMLSLKNACPNSVQVKEEQAGGSVYTTDVSPNADIYRSFNVGDIFTITSSGKYITIENNGWNAVEISSDCSSWCIIDKYNSRNCN